jgi:hypothetical protein
MPITTPPAGRTNPMALPTEAQTLIQLLQRQAALATRRADLEADQATYDADAHALFASGALGVSEANKIRLIHVRTQAGKVRLLKIIWIGLVNGVNEATAELLEIDEVTP